MKRKIALAVSSTLLCASILSGCASATPVDKYLRSFDKGDSEAASQIYSEEIKDSTEDKEALQAKLKERMDSIYEDFKAGKITSDEAKEKLKSYKEYDTSSVYAFTTINKVTTLQKSKDAYSDAEKAENDGNLADAITNYKSVIEDDPNHETAQAKVLQLSETYTETMKAQAQQEADSKDYDGAISTINTLSDVVGNTDELKVLAQQYSELKNYQYIKVVCTDKGELPENLDKWRFSSYLLRLAAKQIKLAFEQAQKEVDDLHQRTKEGIQTAKLNGKQIGQKQGAKLTTQKSVTAKKFILKNSRTFNGSLDDKECIGYLKIAPNTFYKYKKELRAEQQ